MRTEGRGLSAEDNEVFTQSLDLRPQSKLKIMLTKLLQDISRAKVLVVGDAMLDRYWYGDVERISPEAPVPVVAVSKADERPGGAANVARSVRALGAGCVLFSISGDDREADTLETLQAGSDIACH